MVRTLTEKRPPGVEASRQVLCRPTPPGLTVLWVPTFSLWEPGDFSSGSRLIAV